VKQLLENLQKINEHQTQPLITIEAIVDDETGMYSSDLFDYGISGTFTERCKGNEPYRNEMVKTLRHLADMIESGEEYK
jgi:hypothetical protein